jgi:hypothetical protein
MSREPKVSASKSAQHLRDKDMGKINACSLSREFFSHDRL